MSDSLFNRYFLRWMRYDQGLVGCFTVGLAIGLEIPSTVVFAGSHGMYFAIAPSATCQDGAVVIICDCGIVSCSVFDPYDATR